MSAQHLEVVIDRFSTSIVNVSVNCGWCGKWGPANFHSSVLVNTKAMEIKSLSDSVRISGLHAESGLARGHLIYRLSSYVLMFSCLLSRIRSTFGSSALIIWLIVVVLALAPGIFFLGHLQWITSSLLHLESIFWKLRSEFELNEQLLWIVSSQDVRIASSHGMTSDIVASS